MLLIINIPMVGVFTRLLRTPNWLLVPGILAVSVVGVYSVHATTFDLMLMAGLGFIGYLLRKQGVPMAPLILGFVLGEMMEQNLRRALSITNGELGILVESPISKGLWTLAVVMVVVPPLLRLLGRKRRRAAGADDAASAVAQH
jgi:putative tricarboxylic transport membrane protein